LLSKHKFICYSPLASSCQGVKTVTQFDRPSSFPKSGIPNHDDEKPPFYWYMYYYTYSTG
jgi:hypothetical protein